MTDQNGMMDSQSTGADITLVTPGSRLKEAREVAKLSEADIAAELRIPLGHVQALEADHYEDLVSETFVLGYIRAYSRIVKLDAEGLVKAYHQYRGQLQDTTAAITQKRVSESGTESGVNKGIAWQKPAGLVGGLLVAWLLLFNLFNQDADNQATLSAKPDVAVSEASIVVDGKEDTEAPEAFEMQETSVEAASSVASSITSDAVPEAETALETKPEIKQETKKVTEAEVAPKNDSGESAAEVSADPVIEASPEVHAESVAQSSVVPSALSGLDTLVLSFSGECWLEVTDARGDVLSADLQQDGDRVVLHGQAPFDVMLGNVRAVTAVLNDEPVDLKPRGFRKTLRTQIGE